MNRIRILMSTLLFTGFAAASSFSTAAANEPISLPKKQTDDDPPLPGKDDDPPVPTRRDRERTRVTIEKKALEVTAATADVRAGEEVVAQVRKGEQLELVKARDDLFLVVINGRKGWISAASVKEIVITVEVEEERLVAPPVPSTDGTRIVSRDGAIEVTIADGEVRGKVKATSSEWTMSYQETTKLANPVAAFGLHKGNPVLFVATADKQLMAVSAGDGKLLWLARFESADYDKASLSVTDKLVFVSTGKVTLAFDARSGKLESTMQE